MARYMCDGDTCERQQMVSAVRAVPVREGMADVLDRVVDELGRGGGRQIDAWVKVGVRIMAMTRVRVRVRVRVRSGG